MRSAILVILSAMIFLSGCRTFEPEPLTSLPVEIPPAYNGQSEGSEATGDWWKTFGSEELNSLIQDALTHNFDLKTLQARIAKARASLEKDQAAFFPSLGFSFGGERKVTQVKRSSSAGTTSDGSHSWDSSLTGSYTPDVWGEAGAGEEAGKKSLEAATQDLSEASRELAAKIAETWIDIIAARSRIRILKSQIKTNETLLELQKLRFINGKADALAVSQQREALASASAQVPLLEKQERLLLSSLALLTGKSVVDQVQVTADQLPEPLPLPALGIPADLLEKRPDIQAARMRLSSAQWEVAAARADLLPSFNLTTRALFSSGELDLLFHNWVASLAGSIAGPIFDGGSRKAEVKRARAAAEEQLQLYAGTVASAILEVEDSLVSIKKQNDYIRLLEEELSVARLTLEDARVQYLNGQSTYLSYLVAWTGIEGLERQLVGEQATYIKERIGLYRALGWAVGAETEYKNAE